MSRVASDFDALVFAEPRHINYLCGYRASPFEYRSVNSVAALVLDADGTTTLVADAVAEPYARAAHVDERILVPWYDGLHSAPPRADGVLGALRERLASRGARVAADAVALGSALPDGVGSPGLLDAELASLMRRKDVDELDLIRRAMTAGEAGHAAALREVRPGMSELDVYRLVQSAAVAAAGEPAIVYGDFVSGPRCESGGGAPSARRIQAGELVLLDFSVVVGGYRGDFANTFVCAGEPTAQQRRIHAACLEAFADTEPDLVPGRACREIDARVRAALARRELAEYFDSHAGHGIGLGHPDPPYIVPESTDELVLGDVVTLEPGVYVPGKLGMRYERNYLVTESGPELLSQHELELVQ